MHTVKIDIQTSKTYEHGYEITIWGDTEAVGEAEAEVKKVSSLEMILLYVDGS